MPVSRVAYLILSAALLTACGGGDRAEDTRAPRGVLASSMDANLQISTLWQRPGRTPTASTFTPGTADNPTCASGDDQVDDPAFDSTCDLSLCLVTSGESRYASVLGYIQVIFVNNQTRDVGVTLDQMGYNVVIRDAFGADVWNFEQDNLDYRDLLVEASRLIAADTTGSCNGKLIGALDEVSASGPFSGGFYLGRAPYTGFNLLGGNAYRHRIGWNGIGRDGNPVPAGTYTAHIEVKHVVPETGEPWPAVAPVTFTIAD